MRWLLSLWAVCVAGTALAENPAYDIYSKKWGNTRIPVNTVPASPSYKNPNGWASGGSLPSHYAGSDRDEKRSPTTSSSPSSSSASSGSRSYCPPCQRRAAAPASEPVAVARPQGEIRSGDQVIYRKGNLPPGVPAYSPAGGRVVRVIVVYESPNYYGPSGSVAPNSYYRTTTPAAPAPAPALDYYP